MKSKTLPRLYRIISIVKELHNAKEVPFTWFIYDRKKPPVPYGKAIVNYKESKHLRQKTAIDDLFTKRELEQFIAYLIKKHSDKIIKIEITEEELPIPNNVLGVSGLAVGGETDFYMLHKEKGYDLPFKVEGYYDLRSSKTWREQEGLDPFDFRPDTTKELEREQGKYSNRYIAMTKQKNFQNLLEEAITKKGCLLCGDYKVMDCGLCIECDHNMLNDEGEKARKLVEKNYKVKRIVSVNRR